MWHPRLLSTGRADPVLKGDPSKEGLYVVRLKLRGWIQNCAAKHRTMERDRSFRKLHVGTGEKAAESKGKYGERRRILVCPESVPHYAWY